LECSEASYAETEAVNDKCAHTRARVGVGVGVGVGVSIGVWLSWNDAQRQEKNRRQRQRIGSARGTCSFFLLVRGPRGKSQSDHPGADSVTDRILLRPDAGNV